VGIQRDGAGKIVRAHGMLTDVTESHTQQQAEQLERAFLEGMALGQDLKQLLTTLLIAYENLLTDTMCSVLVLDESGQHVHHLAAPSLPAAYCQAIEHAPIGPQAGSCGTAAYRGETVVVTDIATDPLWANYASLALALMSRVHTEFTYQPASTQVDTPLAQVLALCREAESRQPQAMQFSVARP
jgi:GAF domain-containing protein